jgi:hypothetical protein
MELSRGILEIQKIQSSKKASLLTFRRDEQMQKTGSTPEAQK